MCISVFFFFNLLGHLTFLKIQDFFFTGYFLSFSSFCAFDKLSLGITVSKNQFFKRNKSLCVCNESLSPCNVIICSKFKEK